MQHTGPAARKTRRVVAKPGPAASRFHSDHLDIFVFDEIVEEADGVASATDAGHEHIREPRFFFQDLCARFAADDRLKIANHQRIRMRPKHRAQHVIRRADIRHPIAHRFVDGVFQRLTSGRNRNHARTE